MNILRDILFCLAGLNKYIMETGLQNIQILTRDSIDFRLRYQMVMESGTKTVCLLAFF